MKEVCKVPPRHFTFPNGTNVIVIILAKKLHSHDGKDENNDKQNKCQIGQSWQSFGHNGKDIIERFPGLGQFEHS